MLRETIAIVRKDLLELQLSQIAGDENLREISIVQNYKGSKRCRSPQGLVLNDELPWKKEKNATMQSSEVCSAIVHTVYV